jgi:DNA-binding MarR family transcriptional regulator
VDAGADVSIEKIAARFVMNRTTATRCLQGLGAAGLIRMEGSSKDRRALTLAVTGKGERALKMATPLWRRAQAAIDKSNGPGFAKALRATLNGIRLDVD